MVLLHVLAVVFVVVSVVVFVVVSVVVFVVSLKEKENEEREGGDEKEEIDEKGKEVK